MNAYPPKNKQGSLLFILKIGAPSETQAYNSICLKAFGPLPTSSGQYAIQHPGPFLQTGKGVAPFLIPAQAGTPTPLRPNGVGW